MVVVVYDVAREEERMIVRELERLNAKVELLRADDALIPIRLPADVYLIRTLSHTRGITLAGIVESSGSTSVNSMESLVITWNKAIALSRLKAKGLPVPQTELLVGRAHLGEGEHIVKVVSGSWGRKVSLVVGQDVETLFKHFDDSELHLVQERVGDGSDFRVLVVGGRAVAAMRRRPPRGDWRSNVARGGRAEPWRLDQELEELAVRAAEAVGAVYAGVDVLAGERYVVGEVNGIPEFKALYRATGVNVASEVARLLVELAKR